MPAPKNASGRVLRRFPVPFYLFTLADQIKLGANSKESHLKAEVNILKRTNLRFKGEKALELKKMSKVKRRNFVLV